MTNQAGAPSTLQRRSVQTTGTGSALELAGDGFVLSLASVADSFTPWGRAPKIRDRQLREFWPTEPILASALYSICIRNANFSWTLEGGPETVKIVQEIMHNSDFGRGWQHFITKVCIDLFSQDNGAFIEVIRQSDSPTSPVVGFAHLDSFRCTRTGNPDFPVVYIDRLGVLHRMAWYQVEALSEFPSPVETMYNMQLCAVSRILRAAQYLKDIGIFNREKVAGDNPNAIYLVGGVSSQTISDAMEQHKAKQAERGMTRFILPLIVGSLDPTATISQEQIDLKSLPDQFNLEDAMRWYINQLALGFGADYQDFAPLPGRALGSSTQSLVLHQKSSGKGPAMFMKMMEYLFNFHGLLPSNVTFSYDEQDVAADIEQADLEETTAKTLNLYVTNGTLTPEAARQIMLDKGMISRELFEALQEGEDLTPDVVAQDDEPADQDDPSAHTGGVLTAARHPGRRRKPKREPKKEPYASSKQEDDLADFGEDERLALERTMADQMETVLAKAGREARTIMGLGQRSLPFRSTKQEPEDILTADAFWTTFRQDAIDTMLPLANQAALGAVEVNIEAGVAVDLALVNDDVLAFTARYTNDWWDAIEASTRRSMRRSITAWQAQGLGRQGLPDLADALTPTFGRGRAERIAATEVTRIFDEGNKIAHERGGIQEEEWQTARDTRVDDICRPLDGQRFPTSSGPRPVTDTHIS